MIFCGVDPGVTGGISALDASGAVVACHKMPESIADLLAILRGLAQRDGCFALLEKVNAGVFGRPGAKMGVTSAFTFGRGLGRLETSLIAAAIPYEDVLPAAWQAALGCRTHGDKNISKRRAQALFPRCPVPITHNVADSLLIAEHCRRVVLARSLPEEKAIPSLQKSDVSKTTRSSGPRGSGALAAT